MSVKYRASNTLAWVQFILLVYGVGAISIAVGWHVLTHNSKLEEHADLMMDATILARSRWDFPSQEQWEIALFEEETELAEARDRFPHFEKGKQLCLEDRDKDFCELVRDAAPSALEYSQKLRNAGRYDPIDYDATRSYFYSREALDDFLPWVFLGVTGLFVWLILGIVNYIWIGSFRFFPWRPIK